MPVPRDNLFNRLSLASALVVTV